MISIRRVMHSSIVKMTKAQTWYFRVEWDNSICLQIRWMFAFFPGRGIYHWQRGSKHHKTKEPGQYSNTAELIYKKTKTTKTFIQNITTSQNGFHCFKKVHLLFIYDLHSFHIHTHMLHSFYFQNNTYWELEETKEIKK